MSKINRIKNKLCSDPDSMLAWMDGGNLPTAGYDTVELSGIQISLMLDGYDDIYIVKILPGDEDGTYDVWARMMGSHDAIFVTSCDARDPEEAVLPAMQNLPDALIELGGIM